MCSYIIFVVYMCRIICCLKGFALFYHLRLLQLQPCCLNRRKTFHHFIKGLKFSVELTYGYLLQVVDYVEHLACHACRHVPILLKGSLNALEGATEWRKCFLHLTVDLLKDFVLPVMMHHNCQFKIRSLIDDAATYIFFTYHIKNEALLWAYRHP